MIENSPEELRDFRYELAQCTITQNWNFSWRTSCHGLVCGDYHCIPEDNVSFLHCLWMAPNLNVCSIFSCTRFLSLFIFVCFSYIWDIVGSTTIFHTCEPALTSIIVCFNTHPSRGRWYVTERTCWNKYERFTVQIHPISGIITTLVQIHACICFLCMEW